MPWTPRLKLAVDGTAESILTQIINTQLTSAVLTALASGATTKAGTGHQVTATGITVPAGTYTVSNQVEFNNVAARTLTSIGVRAVGSTTVDYLATASPAASTVVEGTFTLTLTETTELRPLVQTTQTTAANRVVKAAADTRLRVRSWEALAPGEASSTLINQVNDLRNQGPNAPIVRMSRSTLQSIPSGAATLVSFNSTTIQVGGTTGNSGGAVAPVTGFYDVYAVLCWPSPTNAFSGSRYMLVEQWRGGALLSTLYTEEFDASIGGVNMGHAVQSWASLVPLNAGDMVRLKALHTASSALNIGPNDGATLLTHVMIGWRRPLTDT